MRRPLGVLAGSLAIIASTLVPSFGGAQPSGAVVTASNTFGFSLLDRLHGDSPATTVVISPYSLSVALTMVAQGAAGNTADAFTHTLGLDGLGLDAAAEAHASLRQAIEAAVGPQVDLAIANALWGNRDVTFRPGFVDRQQQAFQATIESVDFGDPATVGRINDWVSQSTRGMIDSLVQQLAPDTLLFLANAVYFNGQWTVAFDPAATQDQPFTLADGGTRTVSMMQRRDDHYRYSEGPGFQAVDLPYGDGAFSMTVVLPADGTDQPDWQSWLAGEFPEHKGMLMMPRLDLAYGVGLIDTLAAMGLGEAFDAQAADFSAMLNGDAYIGGVVHKAALRLDEQGTEAAAATGITMERTSIDLNNRPFLMVVDRPFYFAIRHRDTGLVLFLGFVGDPGMAA